MGWLSGWQYRKSHVINSANNAGTNYQVKVKVNYGSGTDSGENVYLSGKCRTDFGDIRFTRSNGETLLDYWMESYVTSNYAIFWVEITDNLSANNATIYIYYGNNNATYPFGNDQTYMDNTFLFADHFYGTTLNTTKWTPTGTYSVANSELTLTGNNATHAYVLSKTTFGLNTAVRTRWKYTVLPDYGQTFSGFGVWGTHFCVARAYGVASVYQYLAHDGTEVVVNSDLSRSINTYHVFDVMRESSSLIRYRINDAYEKTITTNIPTGSLGAGLFARGTASTANSTIVVDWIIVRKYVYPEPSHGSWGSEELPPQQKSKTIADYLGCRDTITEKSILFRVRLDYLGLKDVRSRLSRLYRNFIGKVALLDNYSKKVTRLRLIFCMVTEFVGVLDGKIKKLSLYRSVIERLGGLDVRSRMLNLHRVFTDYVGSLDIKIKKIRKILSELIGMLDSKSLMKSLRRKIIECLGIFDGIRKTVTTYVKKISKTIEEHIGLYDRIRCSKNKIKVFVDQLAFKDLLRKVKVLNRRFVDYIGLYDLMRKSVYIVRHVRKMIGEYFGLLDVKSKGLGRRRVELIGLYDVKKSFRKLVRSYLEIVCLVDLRLRKLRLYRVLFDFIGSKDRIGKLKYYAYKLKYRYRQHPKVKVNVE